MERLYSLFRKEGKHYVRVEGAGAYRKPAAVRIFQDRLINSAFSAQPCSLRPVKAETPTRLLPSQVLCNDCVKGTHFGCTKGECACACRRFNG